MRIRQYLRKKLTMQKQRFRRLNFCLPMQPGPPVAGIKPSVQWQLYEPGVLLHLPPLQIRGLSLHSSTSVQVRPSKRRVYPEL